MTLRKNFTIQKNKLIIFELNFSNVFYVKASLQRNDKFRKNYSDDENFLFVEFI